MMKRWVGKVTEGDALEVLREMPDGCIDLVLTDPPYPDLKGGLKVTFTSGVARRRNVNKTVADPWKADLAWLSEAWRVCKHGLMCFCSFHSVAKIPEILGVPPIALISWYQRNAMPSMNNSPHFQTEYIWVFKKEPGLAWKKLRTHYDIPRLQSGCMATERLVNSSGEALHKCQKPLRLMRHLLAIGAKSVLDPFCGTGTTLVAAAQIGLEWIGIDSDPACCEMSRTRIAQETAQTNMFHQKRS